VRDAVREHFGKLRTVWFEVSSLKDTPTIHSAFAMESAPLPSSDKNIALKYLGLPDDYHPSPSAEPLLFLAKHLTELSPDILVVAFPDVKQRTHVPTIRNRRLKYIESRPREFEFDEARSRWPSLWSGPLRRGPRISQTNTEDDLSWVRGGGFLNGSARHVGKLGELLAAYEEERDAEDLRLRRAEQRAKEEAEFIPEEDSESEEDEDSEIEQSQVVPEPEPSPEEFVRRVHEKFIYGLLSVSAIKQLRIYRELNLF